MHLPIESAFVAAERGSQAFRGWDQGRYMQAQLIDSIRALQYVLIMVNRDPDKRAPDPPDPYPIPDIAVRRQQKKEAPPGSFAYIAQRHIDQVRKQRERGGQCPEEQAAKK